MPAEDRAGHARIRDASRVPIQTGENWWFGHDMAHAIAAGACDFCMPDLMKIGGVTGWVDPTMEMQLLSGVFAHHDSPPAVTPSPSVSRPAVSSTSTTPASRT